MAIESMKKLLTMLTPLTLMGLTGVAPVQAAIVAGWNSLDLLHNFFMVQWKIFLFSRFLDGSGKKNKM